MNVVKYISESHRTRLQKEEEWAGYLLLVFLNSKFIKLHILFPCMVPCRKKRKYIKTIELIIKLYDSRDLCFLFFVCIH